MTERRRGVPMRCPSCRPVFRVRSADGRRIGWTVEATYVGFLRTDAYAGWKRPPQNCPNCGVTLEEVVRE